MTKETLIHEIRDGLGRITLNRPEVLNALGLEQIRAMTAVLEAWRAHPEVRAVVVTGKGSKAFCAGGDIRSLFEAGQRGEADFIETFYREEYSLYRLIKTYPKPYIAVMDGIVMGGGAGISVHGSHRIATEHTMFAMPETGIGLFPDAGGTHFLPRAPGRIGVYLALTGARIKAADTLYCGFASHYVPSSRLNDVFLSLSAAEMRVSEMSGGDVQAAVTVVLDIYHEDPGFSSLERHRAVIDRCFDKPTVEEIMAALAQEKEEFAQAALAMLRGKSPSSLKVTLRQMQVGPHLSFDQAMSLEFRLARRFMEQGDFFEGVRAMLIDKDRNPKWRPETLAAMEKAEVDAYFRPLESGELSFD